MQTLHWVSLFPAHTLSLVSAEPGHLVSEPFHWSSILKPLLGMLFLTSHLLTFTYIRVQIIDGVYFCQGGVYICFLFCMFWNDF